MSVLVDTSVWSLAFRRKKSFPERERLEGLIEDGLVRVIGPIRQELLSGIRDEKQFESIRQRMAEFPDLPLESADYVDAARCFNRCRAEGIQASNTDLLICAASLRHELTIFSMNKGFQRLASILPIDLLQ